MAKRSRHRVPTLTMTSDEITPEYQSEVNASMARLEQRYKKAQKALAAAEAKAERARAHAEALEEKQDKAQRVAQHRAEEEAQISVRIAQMKQAAQESRVSDQRARIEQAQRDFVARRQNQTDLRKAELKAIRERNVQIALQRNRFVSFEAEVSERRRELHEIEMLMIPGNYAGRDHRKRTAQHRSG